jgi:hypothetical protein
MSVVQLLCWYMGVLAVGCMLCCWSFIEFLVVGTNLISLP